MLNDALTPHGQPAMQGRCETVVLEVVAIDRFASMNDAVGESRLRKALVVVVVLSIWAAHVFGTSAQLSVDSLRQIVQPLLVHELERTSKGSHTLSAQGLVAVVN